MDFRSEHYLEAAVERKDDAIAAFRRRDFGLSMWIGGVAVECVLRAYRTRKDPSFHAGHNLPELLKQSGLLSVIESDERARARPVQEVFSTIQGFRADLNAVSRLWHNNFRYASTARLKAHLKAAGVSAGIKGDFLKENARKLVHAATRVVDLGVRLWDSSEGN
jgi:hypothetical protein